MDTLTAIFVFIVGAMTGSFLNVCIVRLPRRESIVVPRSRCVHCQKQIPWYDNIPLLSYWILKRCCRFCGKPISFRYFVVEVLTASLFLFFYLRFGLTSVFLSYLVFLMGLIIATFIDLELRIIPDEISVGGMFVGFLASLMVPALHETSFPILGWGRLLMRIIVGICVAAMLWDFLSKREVLEKGDIKFFTFIGVVLLMDLGIELFLPPIGAVLKGSSIYLLGLDAAIIGAMIGGGAIYVMGLLGDFLFKRESMGGGDVKLMAMIGAFLGWKLVVLSFFVAPFFGAIYGIIEKLRTKDSAIAYGPFLSLGALVCLFWGETILSWIFAGPLLQIP